MNASKSVTGSLLFWSSIAIWATNIIVFALWYWELDRGGPDARLREDHECPDFLFPQMVTPGCTCEPWTPRMFDYIHLAFTSATAFSPADVMPLTRWAKALTMVESTASLATVTIVAARAIGIIS